MKGVFTALKTKDAEMKENWLKQPDVKIEEPAKTEEPANIEEPTKLEKEYCDKELGETWKQKEDMRENDKFIEALSEEKLAQAHGDIAVTKNFIDKFMCHCSGGEGALDASNPAGKALVEQLRSIVERGHGRD